MKKSLLALAVLAAFAGAASAQSSVTLYGQIDANIQHIKAGDNTAGPAGDSITKLADGVDYGPGSRWGLRVVEDLGGGLTGNVVLESGFAVDSGTSTQGGRLFGRQAFISLASTAAGEVRLGRQYALHDEVMALNNPFGNATVLNPGAMPTVVGTLKGLQTSADLKLPLFIDAPRLDNVVQYLSPNLAGFRAQLALAPGEGVNDRYQGIKASYGNGPLNLAASYESSRTANASATPRTVNKVLELAGNYDLGVVKLMAGYQHGKDLTTGVGTQAGTFTDPRVGGIGAINKLRAYTLGVSAPFGPFTVAANYTRDKYENAAGGDATLGRFGIGANYALSKLTSVYTAFSTMSGDLKEFVVDRQVFQLGLRKAF